MNEKVQSFFITNFPNSWDPGALWKMFSHYRRVVDVYIAFKRTKNGIRFGFVRFKILMISWRLKEDSKVSSYLIPPPMNLGVKHLPRREKNRFIHSFKDTVVGTSLRPQPSTLNVRVEEGLSLLFEWKSKDLARGSLESNKIWLMQWFDDLQLWDEKCNLYGRLIWLNLEGLPVLARNNRVVKSVAGDRTLTDEVNFENDCNNDKLGFSSRHEKDIDSLINPSPLSSNRLPLPPPYELYLADSSPIMYLVKPTPDDVYHNPNSFDIHDLNIPHMASGESNQDELELDELLCSFQRISNLAHQYLGGKKKKQKYKKKLTVDGSSLNCNGLGADNKKSWIRSLVECENPLFFGIHETKLDSINQFCICSLWPRNYVDFAYCNLTGASGGINTIWDSRKFLVDQKICDRNVLGVIGSLTGILSKVGLLNVYAPQSGTLKDELWNAIEGMINSFDAIWIILFVARVGLFDFPPEGRRFTRFDKYGKKASKLDRFLVSHNLFDFWKDASVTVLCRSWSDHCPISLKVGLLNSSPKPYIIFDKWIGDVDLKEVIANYWASNSFFLTPNVNLKNKLKILKLDIKAWTTNRICLQEKVKDDLIRQLGEWDVKSKNGLINEMDVVKREE
ncbi:RNA-directed DNA polymerase, eukaryota [Tanacetum coccineum]